MATQAAAVAAPDPAREAQQDFIGLRSDRPNGVGHIDSVVQHRLEFPGTHDMNLRRQVCVQAVIACHGNFHAGKRREIIHERAHHGLAFRRERRELGLVDHPAAGKVFMDKNSHVAGNASPESLHDTRPVNLIPVIDLKQGLVVHAREGRRSEYEPIRSTLCAGADAQSVVAALLELHPFRTFYIADIDAIQGAAVNAVVLERLRERFANVEFWVDAGIGNPESFARWTARGSGRAVIGSESMHDPNFIAQAIAQSASQPPVLSLDFLGEAFLGPQELLDGDTCRWPDDVLAMNLRKVGSESGPDLELISKLIRHAPDRRIYAAGGVRDIDDIFAARNAGAHGVLLATALHDGRIGPAQLRRIE